jgi:hypothetical protein
MFSELFCAQDERNFRLDCEQTESVNARLCKDFLSSPRRIKPVRIAKNGSAFTFSGPTETFLAFASNGAAALPFNPRRNWQEKAKNGLVPSFTVLADRCRNDEGQLGLTATVHVQALLQDPATTMQSFRMLSLCA